MSETSARLTVLFLLRKAISDDKEINTSPETPATTKKPVLEGMEG